MHYSKQKQEVLGKLKFRASDHAYTLGGMRIPSVTQVIEPLLPYESLPKEIRAAALLRGDLVHKLTALVDESQMSAQTWDEAMAADLSGYMDAWAAFKQATDCAIIAVELRVFHRTYRYAGTLDRLVHFGDDDVVALLEIKTGELLPEYALQTAAYLHAVNDGRARGSEPVERRYAVQLMPNGHFHLWEHKDRADFQVFLAALTIKNWRLRYQ